MADVSLFQLDAELKAAIVAMDELVDETTGEIPADAMAEYAALEGKMKDKLFSWSRWWKNERAILEAAQKEARTLAATVKRAKKIMEFISMIMENRLEPYAAKDQKGSHIFDGVSRLSWRSGTKVVGFDMDTCEGLPDEFVRVTREPKLREIQKHIDEHGPVKWAQLKTEKHLAIR